MKKYICSIWLMLLCALCAHAETLLLRTGARVKGEIVLRNDDVVILRDASGARFQYPMTDILEIIADEAVQEEKSVEEEAIQTSKRVSILIEISGGGAFIPNQQAGGAVSADLLVGSHHLADRHIFVGAGVGYHGLFIGEEKYNFLPIQVALRMPLMEQKHAPVFGVAAGYGIALSKDYRGGIYADIDFGYRYQINEKSALALVLFAQFQQAKLTVSELIDGIEYSHTAGRSLVSTGLKLGFYF